MKRFEELSDEEIYELSGEDFDNLVDLECAHEGIPFLPDEPQKLTIKEPNKDLRVSSFGDINLTDPEEANELLIFLNKLKSRVTTTYWTHSGYLYKPATDPVEVRTRDEYSVHAGKMYEDEMKRIDAQKNEYEEEKARYDEISGKRQEIVSKITERQKEIADRKHLIERYLAEYRRYLALSEGEKQIALNFLKAAHPGSEEIIEEVITKHCDDVMLGKAENAA